MKSYSKILIAAIFIAIFNISCSEHQDKQFATTSLEESATVTDTNSSENRLIIKTADISLDVNRVEESVLSFQNLVNTMGGHVYHYEIQNQKVFLQEVQKTIDSGLVVNEIRPEGKMKVKVPVQYGDTFIASVLKMNGRIENFMFDENDVTEEVTEKKELMLSDAGYTDAQPQVSKAKKPAERNFDRNAKESFIRRKADYSKLNYRTQYLWFDIQLKGNVYTESYGVASSKTARTPFYVSVFEALNTGWYGFSGFLVLLISIWPFIILGIIIFVAYRRKWFKMLFQLR